MPKSVSNSLPHAAKPEAVYGTKNIIIIIAARAVIIFLLS